MTEEKRKRGRPAIGNAKPRVFGRVHDGPWDKIKLAAKIVGKSFTEWALDVLLVEAEKIITHHEKTRRKQE